MQQCCRNRETPLGYIWIWMKHLVAESTEMSKNYGIYLLAQFLRDTPAMLLLYKNLFKKKLANKPQLNQTYQFLCS